MEGVSRNKDAYPQLLDLIHKDKEWIMREEEKREEKKLELRLGPPGDQDWFCNENNKVSPMASKTNSNNWLVNNNNNCGKLNHKVLCSPWQMKSQQHSTPSYLQFPQNLSVVESSQTSSKAAGELQSHPDKNNTSPPASSVNPANTSVNNSSQKRTAPSPVVGWPPIRSFRKNLASSSYSKPSSEPQSEIQPKEGSRKPDACSTKGLFVKINMDGVPIGRKVDLKAYDSYERLSSAVDELFRGLLAAQRDSPAPGNHNKMAEVKEITGLLDGSGEYTLVYEDNEGDRMLVGDVPWHMFVSTVKRLRVLKSSELSALQLGSSKQGRTRVDSAAK